MTCPICHPTCSSCNGLTANDCLNCRDIGVNTNSPGPGTCTCPAFTVWDTSRWRCRDTRCQVQCDRCDLAKDSTGGFCTDCKASNAVRDPVTGICNCPTGSNMDPVNGVCISCHSSCATCTGGNGVNQCTDCYSPAVLGGASPNYCRCPPALTNYFFSSSNGVCSICYWNCATCGNG